jgi:hypothetical protein
MRQDPHDPVAISASSNAYNQIEGQPLPPDDSAPPELTRQHGVPVDSRYSAKSSDDKTAVRPNED